MPTTRVRTWAGRGRLAAAATMISLGGTLAVLCLVLGGPTIGGLAALTTACLVSIIAASARRHRYASVAVALVTAAGAAAMVLPWPETVTTAAPVREVLTTGEEPPAPWFGLVPEIELVRVGAALGLTPDERASIRNGAALEQIYTELSRKPVLQRSASRVVDAWLVDRPHYRLVLPDGAGPFPLLLFLHGNGGPFQSYAVTLLELAEEHGIAVALPTFGFGDWHGPTATERIESVHRHVLANFPIRPGHTVIGGLSAGAIGALEHYAANPTRFRTCIAISGVPLEKFDPSKMRGAAIVLLTGTRDRRIPIERVRAVAELLRGAGAEVNLHALDADHFLFAAHSETARAILRASCR